MFKLIPLTLFIFSLTSCEIPDSQAEAQGEHTIQQESVVQQAKVVNPSIFEDGIVYDVKYVYTINNCKGTKSKNFNGLTFEALGQAVMLDQQHIFMIRQKPCAHKVGVYANWDSASGVLNDIQGDFSIGNVQEWDESYGRINVSGVGLSGYIRNIKVEHKGTVCTVDEFLIEHGLKVDVKVQDILCKELQAKFTPTISI